jgi:hypothetical protein
MGAGLDISPVHLFSVLTMRMGIGFLKRRGGNFLRLAPLICLLFGPASLMLLGALAPSWVGALPLTGLYGATEYQKQPSLSWRSWLDRSFQRDFAAWFAENIGPAREVFIRIDNGIYALAFSKTLSSGIGDTQVIVGKDWVLYERGYIREFCGKPDHEIDFAPIVRLVRETQQKLARHHIAFAMMISPSKAAIYPQFIPEFLCLTGPSGERLYDRLLPLITDQNLPIIDGHRMLTTAIKTAAWPLFPHYGTHWNAYGVFPVIERLITVIEAQIGRPLVHLSLERVDVDDLPTGQDADIGRVLNLPFRMRYYPSPHAVFRHTTTGSPLQAIFIGSSFLDNPLTILVDNGVIERSYFYYYDSAVRRVDKAFENADHAFPTVENASAKADLHDHLPEVDAVVVEVNEDNLGAEYLPKALHDISAEADRLGSR